jgi:hypothetical protein
MSCFPEMQGLYDYCVGNSFVNGSDVCIRHSFTQCSYYSILFSWYYGIDNIWGNQLQRHQHYLVRDY